MGTPARTLQRVKDLFSSGGIGLKLIRKRPDVPAIYDPYSPEQYSTDIHESQAIYNALIGSPGLGKTITGAHELARFIRQGKGNGMILMPTFGMAYQTALLELRKWIPKTIHLPRSPQNPVIRLGAGRHVFIRSAEHPERIDGLTGISFIWIDEPELMDESVWLRAKERLFRQTGGIVEPKRVVTTGTPQLLKGKSWIKDLFWQGYNNGDPDFFCRRATIWESTRYTEEEKARIEKENPPGTWTRARYDAEWTAITEGIIYPELPRVGFPFVQYDLLDSEEIIFGIDLAYHPDPFVFTVLGRKGNVWTLFAEWRGTNMSEGVIAAKVADLVGSLKIGNRFNLIHRSTHPGLRCYHDHDKNQMNNFARELKALGIFFDFHPARKQNKDGSLTWMRDLMIKNHFQVAHADQTYYELCSYHREGRGDASKVSHGDSHGPDAIRYALWTHHVTKDEQRIIYSNRESKIK